MQRDEVGELVALAAGGRRSALARLLTLVERGGEGARIVGRVAHPLGGAAYTVGITGAPGAGKSTLTNALCGEVRTTGDRIAILAIDPSSPFSGGAILGDRIRMSDHALDEGVFIRSMATRGHLGGLALATPSAIRLLDAVGFPWVLVETVGVGQVEVEIVGSADTCVVVVNPRWGDAVQANKAGLMEIADVFIVNKADRPGATETRNDLESMLGLRPSDGWTPRVVCTVSTTGEGISEAWQAVRDHREWLEDSGERARRIGTRTGSELRSIVAAQLADRAARLTEGPLFDRLQHRVIVRELDPWSAADQLLGPAVEG